MRDRPKPANEPQWDAYVSPTQYPISNPIQFKMNDTITNNTSAIKFSSLYDVVLIMSFKITNKGWNSILKAEVNPIYDP